MPPPITPPVAAPPPSPQQAAYDALKSAVLGSGLSVPEVSGYYGPERDAAARAVTSAGGNYNTNVAADNAAAAAKAAAEAKLKEAQDMQDPNKYQQVAKQDGGYTFLDPSGKEISAWQYARVTGSDPAKLLSQSQNPVDIGFVNDYKNLQDYITAKVNAKNDPSGAGATASQIEGIVQKQYGVNLAKMNISDVIKRFQQAYPTVFGLHKPGVSAGQTLLPTSGSLDLSGGAGGVGG